MFGSNNLQANRPGQVSPGQTALEPVYISNPDELSEELLELVSGGPMSWPNRYLLNMRQTEAYSKGGNSKLALEFFPATHAFR